MTTMPVQRFYGASSLTITASGYTNSLGNPVEVPLDLSSATIITIDCSQLQVTMGKSFLRLTNATKTNITGKSVTLSFKTLANSNGILLQNLVIVVAGEFFASGKPVTFTTSASTLSTRPMITLLNNDDSYFVVQSKVFVSSSDDNISLPPSFYSTSKVLVAAGGGEGPSFMKYSEDNGKTWNDASGQDVYPVFPRGIAYNGLKWIAVGYDDDGDQNILTSTDGKLWTKYDTGYDLVENARCVAWNQELGLWLIGANRYFNKQIVWSDDNGNSWNTINDFLFDGGNCRAIATSGIYCVAVSDNNYPIAISSNGKDWSSSDTNIYIYANTVATNGTIWVVGGEDDDDGTLAWSDNNGLTWTPVYEDSIDPFLSPTGDTSICKSVATDGTTWVAGGYMWDDDKKLATCLAYSKDGKKWTPVRGDAFSKYNKYNDEVACEKVIYNGSQWFATSDESDLPILTSINGSIWTELQDPFAKNRYYSTQCFGTNMLLPFQAQPQQAGNDFILVGSNEGNIAYSSNNGESFGVKGSVFNFHDYESEINSFAWNGSMWLCGRKGHYFNSNAQRSDSTILSSFDGINWTQIPIVNDPFKNYYCYGIAWSEHYGLWVAGGGNSNEYISIATSSDGRVWTRAYTPFDNNSSYCYGIATSGMYTVAVGNSPRICISSDIRDPSGWKAATTHPFGDTVRTIATNGTIWVAGGDGDDCALAWSDNSGVSWTACTTNSGNDPFYTDSCYTVATNGNRWVAGGGDFNDRECPNGQSQSYTTMFWSDNGKEWTPVSQADDYFTIHHGYDCGSVVWTGSLWVACTNEGGGENIPIQTSVDGIKWINASVNPFELLRHQDQETNCLGTKNVLPFRPSYPVPDAERSTRLAERTTARAAEKDARKLKDPVARKAAMKALEDNKKADKKADKKTVAAAVAAPVAPVAAPVVAVAPVAPTA